MDPSKSENARLALAGELFHAFVPELTAARSRCKHACDRYNTAGEVTRRQQIELWRDIVQDGRPLPPVLADEDLDAAQLMNEPWIEAPIRVDYGTNLRLGSNVYINFNCTVLDTSLVTIGSRTLLASNVSLYGVTHPLDPVVRNGTKGPELGKEIRIGSDCFIGGSVTICPGVTIGNGSTIGAGSVVTKDVPAMCVVAGNPARILRWLDGSIDDEKSESTGMPNRVNVAVKEVNGINSGGMLGIGEEKDVHTYELEHPVLENPERKHLLNELKLAGTHVSAEKEMMESDGELRMTKQEWEDEMGRQIAERALSYGASLK